MKARTDTPRKSSLAALQSCLALTSASQTHDVVDQMADFLLLGPELQMS